MPLFDRHTRGALAAAESFREMAAAFESFALLMEEQYHQACEADPGLHEAVQSAYRIDPGVGWLDVAALREKERR